MAYAAPVYKQEFRSGYGLGITVIIGNIIDVDADGIVTGEDEKLEHESLVTQAIIKRLPEFKEKRNQLKNKRIKAWTVRKTPVSDSLKFKYVFHAIFKTKDDKWEKKMEKLYAEILKKAKKRQIRALAIPLLGTGRGGVSPNDAAKPLLIAIAAHKPSSLQQLMLIAIDWKTADTISTQCLYQLSQSGPTAKEKSMSLPAKVGTSSGNSGNYRVEAQSKTDLNTEVDLKTRTDLNIGFSANIGTQATKGVEVRPKTDTILKRALSEPASNPKVNQRRHVTSLPEELEDSTRMPVPTNSDTYEDVVESFLRSFQTQPTIKEIFRIENKDLENQYLLKKKQFLGRPTPSDKETERVLWHRTSEDLSSFICTNGFNRGRCGRDGPAGDGVYFTTSPDAPIEDTQEYSAIEDVKYVFRARVLTGTYTLGMPGSRVPPKRTDGEQIQYDSTVDNVNNSRLYVIYNDTQAYPEYLITYI